jgi:hypothetical protein
MKVLNFLLGVAAAVVLQTALARLSGSFSRYVDLTLLPVVWYCLRGTQRSAMLAGCAVGLIHDAWLRLAVFGLTGFKRTLLGWLLAPLGARFDLNHSPGRFAVGVLLALGDGTLDNGLRRLMDLSQGAGWLEIVGRALSTGLLAAVVFAGIDGFRRSRSRGRLG